MGPVERAGGPDGGPVYLYFCICVFVFVFAMEDLCICIFVFVFALEDLMHPLPIASKIRRTGRQGNLDLRDPDDNDNQGWIQKQE